MWRDDSASAERADSGAVIREFCDRDALIAEANRQHRAAEQHAREAVRRARAAGQALLQLKQQFGHGHWGKWFQDNRDRFSFSARTARLYMQLADLDEANWQRVANLALREAARMAALLSGTAGSRQAPPPVPSIDPDAAALVDLAVQLAGADVVACYLRELEDANPVSLQRFEQLAASVRRQLSR
jgi:hypothetical protein